jgi:hypothetical protein
MTLDQLRKALSELNGERDAVFAFAGMAEGCAVLRVPNAMLIPDEGDALIKVTDGKSIYIIHSEAVHWVRIDLAGKVGR